MTSSRGPWRNSIVAPPLHPKLSRRACLCIAVGLFTIAACSNSGTPTTATTTTAPATSLITPDTTVLAIGQTQLFTYSTATATDGIFTWTSSNPGILAIDNTGLATGLSSGLSTITGQLTDGTSSTLSVQVVPNYQGLWAGTSTVIACTDVLGFTSAGYCSQVSNAVQQWTLTLLQTGLSVSGTMTKSEGASVLTGNVSATVGGSGDLIAMTGTLAGVANGTNLVVTPISWDSFAAGSNMTGSWSANVTSSQVLGSATLQWSLIGALQGVSATASRTRSVTSAPVTSVPVTPAAVPPGRRARQP
jgi:Bacterial Ig-like domain (group 2)